jgi:hypothetical protein
MVSAIRRGQDCAPTQHPTHNQRKVTNVLFWFKTPLQRDCQSATARNFAAVRIQLFSSSPGAASPTARCQARILLVC